MSIIKDLKNSKKTQINLIDLIEQVCSVKKTKYVETFYRLLTKTTGIAETSSNLREDLKHHLNIKDTKYFDDLSFHQVIMVAAIVNTLFDSEDFKMYNKFCEFNERGLIKQNDLSKYKEFGEIIKETEAAELIEYEKLLEKQVKIVYDDPDWLVLRPLTYESSLKYGSSTKWCTSSKNDNSYFESYSRKGLLIYVIGKTSKLKVGCFKSLKENNSLSHDPELSFWDVKDNRIDSMESGLPPNILQFVWSEIHNKPKSNLELAKEMKIDGSSIKKPSKWDSSGGSGAIPNTMRGELEPTPEPPVESEALDSYGDYGSDEVMEKEDRPGLPEGWGDEPSEESSTMKKMMDLFKS